jgi:hypothetical protein
MSCGQERKHQENLNPRGNLKMEKRTGDVEERGNGEDKGQNLREGACILQDLI